MSDMFPGAIHKNAIAAQTELLPLNDLYELRKQQKKLVTTANFKLHTWPFADVLP